MSNNVTTLKDMLHWELLRKGFVYTHYDVALSEPDHEYVHQGLDLQIYFNSDDTHVCALFNELCEEHNILNGAGAEDVLVWLNQLADTTVVDVLDEYNAEQVRRLTHIRLDDCVGAVAEISHVDFTELGLPNRPLKIANTTLVGVAIDDAYISNCILIDCAGSCCTVKNSKIVLGCKFYHSKLINCHGAYVDAIAGASHNYGNIRESLLEQLERVDTDCTEQANTGTVALEPTCKICLGEVSFNDDNGQINEVCYCDNQCMLAKKNIHITINEHQCVEKDMLMNPLCGNKLITKPYSTTLLDNPNVYSNSPIMKEALDKKLLRKGFTCVNTSKSSMSYYNAMLDLELCVYSYHPYVSAMYVKKNENHPNLDGLVVEEVIKWLDEQPNSGISIECLFNIEGVSVKQSNRQVTSPHQLKVGDKVRILSDAQCANGTVVDAFGCASAIGYVCEVESVSIDGSIGVKTPFKCGGFWLYNYDQLAPIQADKPLLMSDSTELADECWQGSNGNTVQLNLTHKQHKHLLKLVLAEARRINKAHTKLTNKLNKVLALADALESKIDCNNNSDVLN